MRVVILRGVCTAIRALWRTTYLVPINGALLLSVGLADSGVAKGWTRGDNSKPRLERVVVAGGVRGDGRDYTCHHRASGGIVGSMMSWIKPMSFACWGLKVVPAWIIPTTLSDVRRPSVPSAIVSAIIR